MARKFQGKNIFIFRFFMAVTIHTSSNYSIFLLNFISTGLYCSCLIIAGRGGGGNQNLRGQNMLSEYVWGIYNTWTLDWTGLDSLRFSQETGAETHGFWCTKYVALVLHLSPTLRPVEPQVSKSVSISAKCEAT